MLRKLEISKFRGFEELALRDRLPGLKGQLPRKIEDILERAPLNQLGPPEDLVPQELRELLQYIAS